MKADLLRCDILWQVVQQCTGYRAITSRFWWHKLLVLLLTPIEALMADMAPDLAARLLMPCGLADADFVLVKVVLLPDWHSHDVI